jgi:hypothetical protein
MGDKSMMKALGMLAAGLLLMSSLTVAPSHATQGFPNNVFKQNEAKAKAASDTNKKANRAPAKAKAKKQDAK